MPGTHRPAFDLDTAAERIRVRPGDPTTVVATAHRRTARRRRMAAGVATVAMLASATTVVRLAAGSDEGTPLAASTGARRGTIAMRWERVEPTSALGMARGMSGGLPLYALSTAPGEREAGDGRPLSRVVWRSSDGVDWAPSSTLGPDLYLSDLDTRGRLLYAVGTAPASARVEGRQAGLDGAELLVGWSDDEGKQWQRRTLPLDLGGTPTRSRKVADAKVVSGPAGVLVVAVLTAQLDVPALLPAGITAPHGWAITEAGVDLLGAPRANPCPDGMKVEKVPPTDGTDEVQATWCSGGDKNVAVAPQDARGVTAHYTWEQLGVGGDMLAAVQRRPIAFFAADGSREFQRVSLPDIREAQPLAVESSERGFDIVTGRGDRYGTKAPVPVFLHSQDGQHWENVSLPGMNASVVAAGAVGGRAAFVIGNDDGAAIAVSDGGNRWTTTAAANLLDDEVLRGRKAHSGVAAIGPFGIAMSVVLAPPDGGTAKDLSTYLLFTRDGSVWDHVSLAEVVGHEQATATRITMTDGRLVVAASVPTGTLDAPRKQVTVVGTLG